MVLARSFLDFIICVIIDLLVFCIIRLSLCLRLLDHYSLNSVIQAAKRKARGYGKKHFKTMAYLLSGKLDLNRVNGFLPTCF